MKLDVPARTEKRREAEYPPMQEQLNMIWKALSELRTKPWSAEVQAMIDAMTAVDQKYPKKP